MGIGSFALLEQRLELGEGLEVARPAGGTLDADQVRQIENPAGAAEQVDLDRERQQLLIAAAAADVAQQVDGAQGRDEREVETRGEGFGAPDERKPRGAPRG